MNIVINPTKCTKTSITASNKIATWISALLKFHLVDEKPLIQKALQQDIDTVIVVNGMFGFCDFRKEIQQLCEKAKEIIWIGNDYALKIPNFIKKNNIKRIAQYHNYDKMQNHTYVDFNKLLHWNGAIKKYKYDGVFYYGAFRNDRKKSFQHWFQPHDFPLHISSSQKNLQEFEQINPKIKLYKPNGDIRKVLHNFQSSLYIEDEFTHRNLMSPANRFYEVIGSKILLLYDYKCQKTLANAGYWDDSFMVKTPTDIQMKLKNYEKLREKQINMFAGCDFRKELEKEFLSVI